MKKMYAAFLLFAIALVAVAVWFSPLTGERRSAYNDNVPTDIPSGLAYADGQTVRVDFDGEQADMYAYLEAIGASVVKTAQAGGREIVYAYSPRVVGVGGYTVDGDAFNVMAAYADGRYSIGAPVLGGSY